MCDNLQCCHLVHVTYGKLNPMNWTILLSIELHHCCQVSATLRRSVHPWCDEKSHNIIYSHNIIHDKSPCAVESHPTPGDSRGSSSPSRSISGVSSHVADGGSARIPLESVHPYLPWSSYLSRSIHSSEHHVIFNPSCSHHVSNVA